MANIRDIERVCNINEIMCTADSPTREVRTF
jgi:hypothetical protein